MGAFGGFLGGIGQGVQNKQKQDANAADPQQQGSSGGGNGISSMFGGQWGILPVIQKALGGGQSAAAPSNKPTPSPTSAIPSPTAGAAGAVQPANNTINTQNQQSGFHGLLPMAQNYYHNHQSKQQDAVGQTHIDALQDPNITPEQRQYHYSGLQQTYANRPDVLKQLGLPSAPGSYNVPSVGASAVAPQAAGGNQ